MNESSHLRQNECGANQQLIHYQADAGTTGSWQKKLENQHHSKSLVRHIHRLVYAGASFAQLNQTEQNTAQIVFLSDLINKSLTSTASFLLF